MDKTDRDQQPAERQEERNAAASTPPRGNPDTDHQSVEKGEQQLEKISGN